MRTFLISLAITAGLASSPATAATISSACSALGIEYELCKSGAEAWAKETGNEVKFVSTPNSATDRLALYLQIMAAQSPDIDVFQIDVVWPGLLASHLIDLNAYLPPGLKEQQFPAVIENDTVNGKLVAMPWFVDAGLLYYRKDLLDRYGARVPEQWSDLEATAKRVRDAERKAFAEYLPAGAVNLSSQRAQSRFSADLLHLSLRRRRHGACPRLRGRARSLPKPLRADRGSPRR